MKVKVVQRPVIRIAVLESDPLRFIGLRTLLEPEQDFELISVALGDFGALRETDVVLLAEGAAPNLADSIDDLKAQQPNLRIIITGSDRDDEVVLRAVAAGAKGYLNEAAPAAEFAQAIRIVNQGLIWAPRRVFSLFIDRSAGFFGRRFLPTRLTDREKEVLEMLVAGRSNKEIAAPLGIEERTVKAHVAKLMRKVGVQNRIKLSVHAITHSLVTPK